MTETRGLPELNLVYLPFLMALNVFTNTRASREKL